MLDALFLRRQEFREHGFYQKLRVNGSSGADLTKPGQAASGPECHSGAYVSVASRAGGARHTD